MAEELGQLFRELRLKKGYSIEDIQEITKIRSRYIEAIEQGKLEDLPGHFYAKAFIKSYGEMVGLDPELIEQYQNLIPDPDLKELPSRTAHSLAKPPSKVGKYLKLSTIYVFIGIVLLLIYMLIVSMASDQPKESKGDLERTRLETTEKPTQKPNTLVNPPTTQKQTTEEPSEQQPVNLGIEVTKTSTTSYKNRSKDIYEVVSTQNQDIFIQLSFNDSCWFEIRKGGPRGKLIVMDTLGKGQVTDKIKLEDQELWIHLGNAAGVQLNVNDNKVTIANEPGPKYISIQKKKAQ
ncbi:helix-turn-helix domain-containing protein [Tepidibacillus fermentans]|uniref:Cytoskeletal protein RodZ n=1 Tax=Tepidibacillus fermentans TaxID=1281767 RepID=A0A4R3KHY7_9BACI|nr:helix-turn-helix domain-containing protein [Tepidibacillus fermentans]TCS83018.1 cytoskeletal protein RodZ [Tepidibacillus fermentans]